MAKSKIEFERWNSIRQNTWPYEVFKKHTEELNRIIWSNESAKKFTYTCLKDNSANWTDNASAHLQFNVPKGSEIYSDLKDWSDSFNQFENWTYLNGLMALSSNFETYLSTIVSLSLESDPGILFDSPKSIDGVILLKKNAQKFSYLEDVIMSVTKGDWNSRRSSFIKLFGSIPQTIEQNIGNLEKLRVLRNKIGHAFGRDIEESRNHEVKEILPMEKVTKKKYKKNKALIWESVKSIDEFLLKNHIGEYQSVRFYHNLFPSLRKDIHRNERAMILKKKIGAIGDLSGKLFCKGLVKYYETL